MNIIQSFWSKPLLFSNKDVYQNRFNGGWINYRYCLLSIAYSCLTISRLYPDLELYTDDYGLKLFRDDLGLPYGNFHTVLNEINIDEALWAYGKIFTYSLQKEPFLHLDNDIFIWQKFPEYITNAKVACQNVEWINPNTTDDYIKVMDYIRKNMLTVPAIIRESHAMYAANMGIFGGNDIEFIQHYTEESKDAIKVMYNDIICSGKNKGQFNVIFEQLLLSELARKENKPICYLKEDMKTSDITKFFNIETAQYDSKFVHCLGALKQSDFICEQIEYRMKNEFPEYYDRIIAFLDRNDLKYPENEESMAHYNDFDEIYSRIKNAESSAELLNNFTLKLKDGYSIVYEGNKYYMKTPRGKEPVKGWGKLLFFFTNPVTGEDVSQYVYQQKLLPNFSLQQIRESIFYLVMQGFFMTKNLIIV